MSITALEKSLDLRGASLACEPGNGGQDTLRVTTNWGSINMHTWREAAGKGAQVLDTVLSPASVQEETRTKAGGSGAY